MRRAAGNHGRLSDRVQPVELGRFVAGVPGVPAPSSTVQHLRQNPRHQRGGAIGSAFAGSRSRLSAYLRQTVGSSEMKKSAIAGAALFAGFALAAPLSAYSQAQPQTAPEQQQNRETAGDRIGAPDMGGPGWGMMGAGMRGDNDEDEGMGWRPRWMQEQMHRRMHDRSGFGGMGGGMARRSPAERCQE